MARETLNTRQIRELLDYVEAEAMAGVYEQRREGDTHPELVAGLRDFISKYGVLLPLVTSKVPLSPEKRRALKEAFLRDWQGHQQAMQTLRPLFDLILAVAEGQSQDEQVRLHGAAFPQAMTTLEE